MIAVGAVTGWTTPSTPKNNTPWEANYESTFPTGLIENKITDESGKEVSESDFVFPRVRRREILPAYFRLVSLFVHRVQFQTAVIQQLFHARRQVPEEYAGYVEYEYRDETGKVLTKATAYSFKRPLFNNSSMPLGISFCATPLNVVSITPFSFTVPPVAPVYVGFSMKSGKNYTVTAKVKNDQKGNVEFLFTDLEGNEMIGSELETQFDPRKNGIWKSL